MLSAPSRFNLSATSRRITGDPGLQRDRLSRPHSFGTSAAALSASTHSMDDATIASVKWDMLRHLQDEKVLLYSLQDRQLAKIQAALRNHSHRSSMPGVSGGNIGSAFQALPWFAFNSRGPFKKRWDALIALVIVFSMFMLPLRLGFDFEASGAWFVLVCKQKMSCVMYWCHSLTRLD